MKRFLPIPCLTTRLLIVVALLVAGRPAGVFAQLQGQVAEKPFAIMYARDVTPARMADYVQRLNDDLQVGKRIVGMLRERRLDLMSKQVEAPVIGSAWYMVPGLIPSFEPVTFQQAADLNDVRQILQSRTDQFGGGQNSTASFTEVTEGFYRLTNQWQWSSQIGPEVQMDQFPTQPQRRGLELTNEILEEDGVRTLKRTQRMTSYFRFHDGMLYEANFEELQTMTLPEGEAVLRAVQGQTDLGFEAYLDRIPLGIRTLAWNMVNAGAGVQMQQRDDEPEELYGLRQSSGRMVLPLIQAVLFDVDHADGWATFADADHPSLQGEARVRTRANGQLSRQLQELASGRSLFAPILDDHAAVTVHLCLHLPAEFQEVASSSAEMLLYQTRQSLSEGDLRHPAFESFAQTLREIGERRTLELLAKVGWTTSSQGVIYGGLQVGDNPELVPALYRLAIAEDPDVADLFSLETTDLGAQLTGRIPEDAISEIEKLAGIRPTHVFLLHANSCLWFAVGGEHADEAIQQAARDCQQSGSVARTPLLSASIDVPRWLEYPRDDPSGITGMLEWLDTHQSYFPLPGPGALQLGDRGERPPLLRRLIERGGDADAQVSFIADDSGLILKARLGEALAHYVVARQIDAQERMMDRMEEQRARAEKAQKEAEEKLKQLQRERDGVSQ
ncbi:MAG: hypothetical protein KDA96_19380 [Planctomycetaceae bacterium]|nr:hypothetical protein [Planctomycetaceae bacterium]